MRNQARLNFLTIFLLIIAMGIANNYLTQTRFEELNQNVIINSENQEHIIHMVDSLTANH